MIAALRQRPELAAAIAGAAAAGLIVAARRAYAAPRQWPRRLTDRQLAELAYHVGAWRGDELERAIRIMIGESNGVVRAVGLNRHKDGRISRDRGIWQFNDRAFPQVTDAIAFDPFEATATAREVVRRGGWRPWWGRTQYHTLRRDGRPDVGAVTRARRARAWIEAQA